MAHVEDNDLPVIGNQADFDISSGNWIERLVFNNRAIISLLCVIVTLAMGYQAVTKLTLQAGFEKMLPKSHPYVLNYQANAENLKGLGNTLRVAVATKDGDVWSKEYLDLLEQVNDEVFYIPGVDRAGMKSIWTPNTLWKMVTEYGFEGGPVIPRGFDGSPEKIEELKINVGRADIRGDLIANNAKSASILLPLLDFNPETGERLNYYQFSEKLEKMRSHYREVKEAVKSHSLGEHKKDELVGDPAEKQAVEASQSLENDVRSQFEEGDISIHIVGFAKVIGELIDGLFAVMGFFAIAVGIAWILLYWYTRCWRSASVVIFVTVAGVIWQLGILATLGYELDPFSILVPFLVFAIGVSHGAQKLNGVIQDMARGTCAYVAARYTFRRLFLAGVTALLSDGVGFAVLMIIQIQVIQDLAITASIGVSVLIFTNLILIPIVLSYTGVCQKAIDRADVTETPISEAHGLLRFLVMFTHRKPAVIALALSLVLAVLGIWGTTKIQVGDLDKGAPELRADSRYNQDIEFVVNNYSVSSDIFAVIVKTEPDGCTDYEGLSMANELEWRFKQMDGVEDVQGLNTKVRGLLAGINEGYPKWNSLFRNQDTINFAVTQAASLGLVNAECSVWPLMVYLKDHKADTLTEAVNILEQFNKDFQSDKIEFLGAAGSAGFEAATNIIVKKANREMMFYVYGAVIMLCLLTFRSVKGVVCAVLPLMLTSVLCEALMVVLGMGIKVATLPVIALGVGIGVDYALYVLTVILARKRAGDSLEQAYYHTLLFTGRVVMLIGVTLAAGVITWAWSPIKFQADMGILLTFMFLWNMVGALILMPALGHFLLTDENDKPAT